MAIAAMLHHNKTLRTVFLGCNDIGPKGAAALADSLKENKTVEGSCVVCGVACQVSCLVMADRVCRVSFVRIALWLKRNSIGPEGAESLARVLTGDNDTQLLLDLVFNKIGPEGGQHLARLLYAGSRQRTHAHTTAHAHAHARAHAHAPPN
jgi:Ran GTPase-activating protein (RanGAP) involved in mRNA processing and transport